MVLQGSEIRVEGVGLVAGLDNTGADPPPSWYRSQLVDEMSKAGVEHASKLLADTHYSMVIVKMTIYTGSSPQDRFDVDVELPPACGTTSLAGGYLMATRLREVMVAGGAPRAGAELAVAQGPVMIGSGKKPNDPKVGRVLGGGRVKKESPFMLVIKDKRRSVRTAAIIESVVNERFHQSDAGRQKGAATAKTEGYLQLKVPSNYHQNQERFFRVVQLLPMVDTPALRAKRMETWGKELLEPSASGVAALRLEGLGVSAGETLRAGLQSPSLQVRFFAAEALAYLDDPSGADALAETAIKLPQFRAYALAALAASDQNACHIKLRHLMDQPDIEVRYGAFNALRTFDAHDPALGQVRVLDEPKVEEDETISSPDAMAVALTKLANRPRVDDPFALYLVDSEGPPVVHVSRTRRSEIVLFGRGQALLPPVVLGTGAILLNAADKDDQIQISKIVPSKFGDNDVKLRTSLELGEVIRRVANLGASYPDVVSILDAANRQKNLPGTLVVDAVPTANMDYLAAAILGRDTSKKVDPALKKTSGRRPQSRLARLLGLGNRDEVATASATKAPSQSADASMDAPSFPKDKGASSPASPAVANAGAGAAPAGSNSSQQASPKRDADLQRAGGAPTDSSSPSNSASTSPSASSSTSSRPRLLDWLFRRSD
jgi:flagellar basal body P-ring protein FlgI